jgi:hypothetical protein
MRRSDSSLNGRISRPGDDITHIFEEQMLCPTVFLPDITNSYCCIGRRYSILC